MKPDVEMMTDADLLKVCRQLPWERQVDSIGCGLSLTVGILVAIGIFAVIGGEAWPFALIAFVCMGFMLNSFFDYAVNFRSRKHQAKLLRRHAPRKLPTDAATAKEYFAIDDPPDWVLDMRGHGLPHGGTRSVEVRWWQAESERGTLKAEFISPVDFSKDAPFSAERGEAYVTAQDCLPLLALLPELETANTGEILSTVRDGFPCTLGFIRRDPFTIRTFGCNLVGIPESSASHPAPRIMTAMLEISERLVTQPVIFGWCDPFGNIGIGGA